MKHRFFSPRIIGRGYDKITPVITEKIDIEDTFQALRTLPIEDLHEHVLKTIPIRDNDRILDAGCGIGGPIFYFSQKKNINIEAINISKVQVDYLKEKILEKRLFEKINVINGDYHNIDSIYTASSFDIVMFLESFGHSFHPEKLVKSVHKVLKKGGKLYIKDPFWINMMHPYYGLKFRRTREILRNHYRFNFITIRKMRRVLSNNGFKIAKLSELDFENSNWEFTYDYETLANFDFPGRGKPYKKYCKYFELVAIKK
jgi:SAM-dependent methyltransferase